ncbi:GntR family transcriptional regulator [Klebsiella pneumoniae]|nr:GntR family transcriptional regulator [Klebsiella pneumoniae]
MTCKCAQISAGARYQVGSRLPQERHIADAYGVSRIIDTRSAADAGAAGDVLDIRQGSGVYVMRIPHENDIGEEERLLGSDVGPFENSPDAPAAGEQHRRLCRENGHPRRYR